MKILEKHNPDNYKAIMFTDKTHYIYDKIQPAKAIIKEIKNIIKKQKELFVSEYNSKYIEEEIRLRIFQN